MKKKLSTILSFRRNLLSEKTYHKKGKQSLLFFISSLASVLSFTSVCAQIDTLIVRGKVENLTLKLYRQAPEISVARVNILQSSREIVRAVQLQPDGSFELKMPLIYPQEECYLTYANVVMPFLGAKGIVEVTIFAESLNKVDAPLRFGGLFEATNNRHARFYTAFNKWLKTNPAKPYKTTNALKYWEQACEERDRRIKYFHTSVFEIDTLLDHWVISSLENATKAQFYNFLKQRNEPIPTALWGIWGLNSPLSPKAASSLVQRVGGTGQLANTVSLDTSLLLTFAKADCYQQFSSHALSIIPPLDEGTLPINRLAALLLQYIPDLTQFDTLKLEAFVRGGSASLKDVKYLNSLFVRKQDTLNLITVYELYAKKIGMAYLDKELDYLQSVFYVLNLNNVSYKQMTQWYNHIRPTLKNPYYIRSLDEIHQIECVDSGLIQTTQLNLNTNATIDNPIETKSGIFLAQNSSFTSAITIWEQIKKKYLGRNIYLIFWTNDEVGRAALEEAQALRERLPENKIAFVYLCEHQTTDELWIQSVVKSKSRGLHLKLSETQDDNFITEWQIDSVPHCVLIDTNGKYIKRKAPHPADLEGWNKIWNKVFR